MDQKLQWIQIASNQTVASGTQPEVNIWTAGFDRLSLRAYRCLDPVRLLRILTDKNAPTFQNLPPGFPGSSFHDLKPLDERIPSLVKETRLAAQWDVALTPTPALLFWAPTPQQRAHTKFYDGMNLAVPVRETGLYLIEASQGTLRAYTVVFVSDLVLLTRSSRGVTHLFAADRRTGAPVPDCDVAASGAREGHVRTDQSGLAEVHADLASSGVLIATRGDDVAAIEFGPPTEREQEPGLASVYTDRPIYRPGDTVHFKGIFREPKANSLEIPKDVPLKLTVTNASADVLSEQELRTSKMGTVSGEVVLPLDAKLGAYYLLIDSKKPGNAGKEVTFGPAQPHYTHGTAVFDVEEYKKPEVKVRVVAEKYRIAQGGSVNVTIEARYYFGQPLNSGRVDYSVQARNSFVPNIDALGYERGWGRCGPDPAPGLPALASGSAILDERGEFSFKFATEASNTKCDQDIGIEARVTDETGRVTTGSTSVHAWYANFRLDASQKRFVFLPSDAIPVDVAATDVDGQPVATPIHVELTRYDGKDYRNFPGPVIAGSTAGDGKARALLHLEEPGSYGVRVVATDRHGREVQATTRLVVLGGKPGQYALARQFPIAVWTDARTYSPGDTARVFLTSEKENLHYFVTVEAGTILNSFEVDAIGPTGELKVPIKPDYAPNFFVHAVAIQNGEPYWSNERSNDITVASFQHSLKIAVEPSQGFFEPGEEATVALRTATLEGKPVSVDLSLGVVDEAIYALRAEAMTDMLADFYPRRSTHLGTPTSLYFWFSDAAGSGVPGPMVGGVMGGVLGGVMGGIPGAPPGAQPAADAFVEPRVRRDFPDTAYWVADVQTDQKGEAQVHFHIPDTLTTWRTTARGVTEDTDVGTTVNQVVARKNVLLRLSTPRFLRTGDEATISATVHNYLPNAKKARMSLDVEGLDVVSGTTREIDVPSGGDVPVSWLVRATAVGSAKLTAKALTHEESDAIETTLPVHPMGVKLRVGNSGILRLTTAGHTEAVAFPADSDPQTRKITIQIAPSLAATVVEGLDYLTTYPWGCTEQTMSSLVPNIVVTTAMKQLGIKSDVDPAALRKKVAAGLAQLYKFQHSSGAWGWWEDDADHPFMTAYVVAGLSQARAAGYRVDRSALERGRKWLIDNFGAHMRPDLQAYMLYAIILDKPDRRLLDQVWRSRVSLSNYGATLLGLALQAASDERAGELAIQIEKAAHISARSAYWTQDIDPLLEFQQKDDQESTALAVQFLLRQDPQSELVPKAVTWLMENRKGGYWQTTKSTAIILLALTEYLKQTRELQGGTAAGLYLNDATVGTYELNPAGKNGGLLTVDLGPAQLSALQNRLRLVRKGGGAIYWSIVAEYFSTAGTAYSKGVKIEREYRKLEWKPQASAGSAQMGGEKQGYTSTPLTGPVTRGDILAVTLTVTGDSSKYLMVEDPIPAGTELVETSSTLNGALGYLPYYEGHEYHDDRASFFRTSFLGRGEFTYFLRVVNAGKFGISSGWAETMYQPDVFSATTMSQLTVN
jgi:uncharacterized protein YfaS (alpha-2-macroglobulin family)